MADHHLIDRTLALAGLAQCAELVQDLARTGKVDQHYLDISIRTLFTFDANSVAEIYGSTHRLDFGLRTLRDYFFKPKSPSQTEIMRYAYQLMQLAKKIQSSSALSGQLGQQLDLLDAKGYVTAGAYDNEMLQEIADVYLDCVSPIKPRVIISGEQGYLTQAETASKVRVCLLCGIRSAHLWLQKGGGKLQLLTQRKAYQNQAQALLAEMI